jgi:hypothetical protein
VGQLGESGEYWMGRVVCGLDHLFDIIMNYGHSWCLRDSRVLCCQVLSLARCILIRITATPSEMGEGLITESKCSNSTFIILYVYHEVEVNYLVVDKMVNISKLFDCNCMFGVCANL